jgi:hypothetical protein
VQCSDPLANALLDTTLPGAAGRHLVAAAKKPCAALRE